jgi:hypothetical protein
MGYGRVGKRIKTVPAGEETLQVTSRMEHKARKAGREQAGLIMDVTNRVNKGKSVLRRLIKKDRDE